MMDLAELRELLNSLVPTAFEWGPKLVGWLTLLRGVLPRPMLALLLVQASISGHEVCAAPSSPDCAMVIKLCNTRRNEVFEPLYEETAFNDVIVLAAMLILCAFNFSRLRVFLVVLVYAAALVGQAVVYMSTRAQCMNDSYKETATALHKAITFASAGLQAAVAWYGTSDARKALTEAKIAKDAATSLKGEFDQVKSYVNNVRTEAAVAVEQISDNQMQLADQLSRLQAVVAQLARSQQTPAKPGYEL